MRNRIFLVLPLLLAVLCMTAVSVLAQTTPAGTQIRNRSSATYEDLSGNAFTATSNELTLQQSGGGTGLGQLSFQFDLTELNPGFEWIGNTLAFTHIAGNAGALGNNRSAHIHEELFTDDSLGTPLFPGRSTLATTRLGRSAATRAITSDPSLAGDTL